MERAIAESDLHSFDHLYKEVELLGEELDRAGERIAKPTQLKRLQGAFSFTAGLLKTMGSRAIGFFRPSQWRQHYYSYVPKLTPLHGGLLLGWETVLEPSLPAQFAHSHGAAGGLLAGAAVLFHVSDVAVYPAIYYFPKTLSELQKVNALGGYQKAFSFFKNQASHVPFPFESIVAVLQHDGRWVAIVKEKAIANAILPKSLTVENTARRAVIPSVSIRELEEIAARNGVDLSGLALVKNKERIYAFRLAQKLQSDSRTTHLVSELSRTRIAETGRVSPLISPQEVLSAKTYGDFQKLVQKYGRTNIARTMLSHFHVRAARALHYIKKARTTPKPQRKAFIQASRQLHTQSDFVRASYEDTKPIDYRKRLLWELRLYAQIFEIDALLRETEAWTPPIASSCSRLLTSARNDHSHD